MSTPTDTKTEEIPEPVDPTTQPVQPTVRWTDANGTVHVDHEVHTDCTGGCYQDVKA